MLASIKMSLIKGTMNYPEEAREAFLECGGLTFKDGSSISASDIWEYMTKEAPRKFPFAYSDNPNSLNRPSAYLEFLWSIKYRYLLLSFQDRIWEAKKNGAPVVFVQGGQTLEPYYAANSIPLRPYFISLWAQNQRLGETERERAISGMKTLEMGRREVSIEACHQVGSHAAIKNGTTPVDLIAPYLCLRCSDMPYLVETHRGTERNTPTFLVDFPVNHQLDNVWAVGYMAKNLRHLVQKIVEMGGKQITDDDLRAQIKLQNRARQIARDIVYMWWNADAIPSYSCEIRNIITLANDFCGDPVAGIQVLEEAYLEIKERVDNGIKGIEMADKPIRLFLCGSCVTPSTHHIDRVGGTVIGWDDWWNRLLVNVQETGEDPYTNLARAILLFPYELPTHERALWTAVQAKDSRSNGLVFAFNWGCNNQSAVARAVCDVVKQELGIPTMVLEMGELGRSEQLEQSSNRIESFIEMIA